MEKDIRDFRPNESIEIYDKKYVFLERESRPGKIHIQEGSQANVVKVKDSSNNIYAIKIFKARFRKEDILERGEHLKKYAKLPGMQAANNEIVNPSSQEYKKTVEKYPFLQYAVIMPWLPQKSGTTWSALRSKQSTSRYPLPDRIHSHKRALQFAKVLNGLSRESIAHCDICPKNVVVDEDDKVYLIDLENYYHHSFSPPPWGSPAGQPGYRHKSIDELKNKQYTPSGDVFAGALLICEMLTWHDATVRNISLDEMLIQQSELQTKSGSYRVVKKSVGEMSSECETLFEAAWFSEKLEDCPPISNWANALENITLAGTEVHTSTTNIHAVSRRKVDRNTVSHAKDITQETSRITANTISPHINRRVSASQIQSQSTKRTTTQPAKPTPPPSYQKPIIQTTSNTQPNTAGWLAGFGGVAAILIFICFIAAMIWLANQ